MTIDDPAGEPAPEGEGGSRSVARPSHSTTIVFEGAREFAQTLHGLLERAHTSAARRICWSDDDFAAWPLGEVEWLAQLTRWARLGGGRELVMIARDYRAVERLHPRFVAWRRDWAHVTRCLVPDESRTLELPTLWVDDIDQALRVFDRDHWRGRAGMERIDRQRAREEFDAVSQRGSPGFFAVTLGL